MKEQLFSHSESTDKCLHHTYVDKQYHSPGDYKPRDMYINLEY